MVLSAHQDSGGVDEMKVFNAGFLAVVTCLLLSWNSLLLVKMLVSEDQPFDWYSSSATEQAITMIPLALGLLTVTAAILISMKAMSVLKDLHSQHLTKLPSKNALTFRDTQILFFTISSQYFLISVHSVLSALQIISGQQTLILKAITHFCINDVIISLVFPIYIIMKTRKYLAKLWDDSAPILKENNDFFAGNPNEVSPNT